MDDYCATQVTAKSGAVKAYYSWKVQNPSEALHDVMVNVDALKGTEVVHIGWNQEAEKNAEQVLISDNSNRTIVESPLYGTVVGAEQGENEFALSYTWHNSAVVPTGCRLSLLTAFAVLASYYFSPLL